VNVAKRGDPYWSAFRDDNLNGAWDDDEPALPGVSVGGAASGVITDHGGWGAGAGGGCAGRDTRRCTAARSSLWLNGADMTLPPLAFRFAGALRGQVFADEDGDGWLRRGGKAACPGVAVSLSGPTSADAVTDARGRFQPAQPAQRQLHGERHAHRHGLRDRAAAD
jgi:hypothetical protein